jgi:thiamine phosphate synthase YjbQ (UPF0047 family)
VISGSSGLGSLFFSVQIFFFVFRVHTVQKFSENENEKDKKDDDMCSLACIAKKKKKQLHEPEYGPNSDCITSVMLHTNLLLEINLDYLCNAATTHYWINLL